MDRIGLNGRYGRKIDFLKVETGGAQSKYRVAHEMSCHWLCT